MRRDPLYVGPSHRKLSLPSALLMTAVGVLSKTFISLGTRHQLILLNRDNIEPLINYIPPAVRELSRYSHRKWWRWPSFLPRTQQQHHPANQNNGSMAPLEEWCHQQPLLTYTNHNSTLDDPLMWTFVSWKTVFLPWRLRWTMAADDICFHNAPLRLFFSHVQTMPITRGAGIYQPSMDHALDIMNSGGWVHIFPEGKVNSEYGETRQMLPFRWGIGRLIMESRIPPLIIPIFHVGVFASICINDALKIN
jgi:1-acyl-sn-glycerol-3-phosphate acyltransferase